MFTNGDTQPGWPSPTGFMTRNKLLRREKKTTRSRLGKTCSGAPARQGWAQPSKGGGTQQPGKTEGLAWQTQGSCLSGTIRKRRRLDRAPSPLTALSSACHTPVFLQQSSSPLGPPLARVHRLQTEKPKHSAWVVETI